MDDYLNEIKFYKFMRRWKRKKNKYEKKDKKLINNKIKSNYESEQNRKLNKIFLFLIHSRLS